MKTYPLYLNGEFVASEPAWEVLNPATGEVFARISTIDRPRILEHVHDNNSGEAQPCQTSNRETAKSTPI